MEKLLAIKITYDGFPLAICCFKHKISHTTLYGLKTIQMMLDNYNERLSTLDPNNEEFAIKFLMVSDKEAKNCRIFTGLSGDSYLYIKSKYKESYRTSNGMVDGEIAVGKAMDDPKYKSDYDITIDFKNKKITMNNLKINKLSDYTEKSEIKNSLFNFDDLDFIEFDDALEFLETVNTPFYIKEDKSKIYEVIE